MEGGAVWRPAQHHDGADDEAEEADQREVVEEIHVALRERLNGDLERLPLVGAQDGILQRFPPSLLGDVFLHGGGGQRLAPIDSEKEVAVLDSAAGGGA